MPKKVLVVLAPGAEEIETVAVADVLVRAGCEVTVAGAEGTVVAGSRGIPLAAHVTLDAVLARDFDCVFLPGGVGSAEYCRDDARIQSLAERQLASGRILACICACPIALLPRRLAAGRRLTCYPSRRQELETQATWIDAPVVRDANLVTSQGPGTAIALGLELARILVSDETAAAVAEAMLVAPAAT